MVFNLDTLVDIELTSIERTAFSRLSDNKDFIALIDVLGRWQLQRAMNLIAAPHEGQEIELAQDQGGWQLLKRMLEYVNTSTPPERPRPLKNNQEK